MGIEKLDFTKWVIGALSSLVLLFGTLYIDSVSDQQLQTNLKQSAQTTSLFDHEQRITTLEESKRNTENILIRMSADLEEIKRAVIR